MDDDIRALASARVEIDALRAELIDTRQALASSPLAVKCAQLKRRIGDMDMARYDLAWSIRNEAAAAFRATGIEHPHPAVTVVPGLGGTRARVHIDADLSAYITEEEGT